MTRSDFKIVKIVKRYAVTHKAAFVSYMLNGQRLFILGSRTQVENQLELLLAYGDFRDDISHACVFVPR